MFISLKLFFYTKKPCSSKAFKFFIKFYVSNEGRDIRLLDEYEIQKACAVDMFPRTANAECCALLKLKNIA